MHAMQVQLCKSSHHQNLAEVLQSRGKSRMRRSGITDLDKLAEIKTLAYPHFLHVMAILFVMNVIIMLVIGKLKPRETDFVLPYTEEVAIEPFKFLVPIGASICAIVIGIYWYFA